MDGILIEMTALASFAIALFGAAFSVLHRRASRIGISFAVFLMAIAVNNGPDAFAQILATLPRDHLIIADVLTWPSSYFLAPLFWLYVFYLTASEDQRPPRLARHFVLPGLTGVVALVVLMSPPEMREKLFASDLPDPPEMGLALAIGMGLLQFSVFPQIVMYLVLIMRRLSRFRLRLRDYYSSTEKHELRWIYVIGGLGFSFWFGLALLMVAAAASDKAQLVISIGTSLVSFLLVSALTLWGIRQSPPLSPDTGPDIGHDAGPDPDPTPPPQGGKYEKSALSPEASARLSRKLRQAMEVDHLHRDANLSLWALARHIGATPNYISQTLNEVMGESFFDFVNAYRIAEAKTLLATTDNSVLTITYDVGFNARSSFYNAFKRHTGQTPTLYRKKMSQREGMDDKTAQMDDL